jgi:DNA-directed RNA polymerase specialized sigma24 family protein
MKPTTRSAAASAPLALEPEARARVRDALRALDARGQLVLVLLLYERLTAAEAAQALGLTTREVERAYRAALAVMARAVSGRATRSTRTRPRAAGTRTTARVPARAAVSVPSRIRRAS